MLKRACGWVAKTLHARYPQRWESHTQQPHHSDSVEKPLSWDMIGNKGTLFLQEEDGLQGLSRAVGHDPATVQRAEAEAAL